jgi:putative ABC transport system substrate-binding protein
MVPKASVLAVLTYESGAGAASYTTDIRVAAQTRGQEIRVVSVNSDAELDRALATILDLQTGALLVDSDAFFINRRDQLVSLVANYKIPTIYAWREIAAAGGLMSYGPSIAEAYQAGIMRRREFIAFLGNSLAGRDFSGFVYELPPIVRHAVLLAF